jgi:nicotinate phosphoribosyltransferase
MMQGYWRAGMHEREACFDYHFRHHPFEGGYTVFAGLEEALRFLEELRFSEEELSYLDSLGLFQADFLDYLRDVCFTGDAYAPPEGSLIFPLEPVVRVQAPLAQCQLVETPLVNTLSFPSLIATKAARVCGEAGWDNVLEFGLRRAQGKDGALTAGRAAYVGGCSATSNVEAGHVYGVPVRGTHAHSWVLAFPSELEAFRQFVRVYPKASVLLVDTFDTLRSGMPNAIRVAREMKQRGETLGGIRLDSGDLAYLSKEARRMLDEAGLTETRIYCSGNLDEHIIRDLNAQGAKIDAYGVGTHLVSAKDDPALSGVYKLAAVRNEDGAWQMRLKLSEGRNKATLPGIKQAWRLYGRDGLMMADWVELAEESPDFTSGVWGYHPTDEHMKKFYDGVDRAVARLEPVLRGGKLCTELPSLDTIRKRVRDELETLHPTMRRLMNPHVYKVSLGPRLRGETLRLWEEGSPEDGDD